MHIEKTEIRWPKIVVGWVNSVTSGIGVWGVCVPNGRSAALPPTLAPLPLNGFRVRRVVWPRRPPQRSKRTAGVPWPAMSGGMQPAGCGRSWSVPVCLGRFRNRE